MVSSVIQYTREIELYVNFASFLIMFFGGLYIAILNRNIPHCVRTPLWYIGACSLLLAISIIVEWISGPLNELSYASVNHFGSMLIHMNVAFIVVAIFFKKIAKDRKLRRSKKAVSE